MFGLTYCTRYNTIYSSDHFNSIKITISINTFFISWKTKDLFTNRYNHRIFPTSRRITVRISPKKAVILLTKKTNRDRKFKRIYKSVNFQLSHSYHKNVPDISSEFDKSFVYRNYSVFLYGTSKFHFSQHSNAEKRKITQEM